MFNPFKKQVSPLREEIRNDFAKYAREVKDSEDVYQIGVGHAINMANSMFIQRFGSIDGFCQRSTSERSDYQAKLAASAIEIGKQDGLTARGFLLFTMWVAAVNNRDQELISEFSKELAYFSRKGDLSPAMNRTKP